MCEYDTEWFSEIKRDERNIHIHIQYLVLLPQEVNVFMQQLIQGYVFRAEPQKNLLSPRFLQRTIIFSVWRTFVSLEHKISHIGIFIAIAKNILYGLKLLIFILCQKSLGY